MERLPPFALRRPANVADAATWLAEAGARPLAGGTDLLPNLRRGLGRPTTLVELGGIAGFNVIERVADGIEMGAGVTLAALAALATDAGSGDVGWRDSRAAVVEAARAVAAPAHRNAATLGGNLCQDTRCVFYNQSEWWRAANRWCLKHGGTTCHVAPQGSRCHAAYSGDMAPALIALDAEVALVSVRGTRRLPLADLYRDDGAAHLALEPGELLASVRLPHPPAGARSGYRKARVRGAFDYPLAGVAIALVADGQRIGQIAVAITGLNPLPLRLEGTEALVGRTVDAGVLGVLGKLVAKQAQPMRTTATPSNHRRQVAVVLAERLLRELADPAPAAAELREAGRS